MTLKKRPLVALVVGGILVASCAGGSDGTPESATVSVETSTTDDQPIEAASGSIVATPNPRNTLSALVSITSPDAVSVELTATSGEHVVSVPRTARESMSADIALVGLRSERDYDLAASLYDVDGQPVGVLESTFTSGAIPERFAPYEFSADVARSSPGYTIIEMQEWADPASITPQKPFDRRLRNRTRRDNPHKYIPIIAYRTAEILI
jgi:hypothetical protein